MGRAGHKSVICEISTIAPNIEVDGKSDEEVRKMVVEFLQNVPLCREDGSRCDHPDGDDHEGRVAYSNWVTIPVSSVVALVVILWLALDNNHLY